MFFMIFAAMPLALSNNEFHEIYSKYEQQIMKTSAYVTRACPSNFDDVFQETSISMYKNLEKFKTFENPVGWLHTVAQNHLHMIYRNEKKRDKKFISIDDDFYHDLPCSTPDPLATLIEDEDYQILQSLLSKFNKQYSAVLDLKYNYGCNVKEISKSLNLKEMNVYQILSRCKREIKRNMKKQPKDSDSLKEASKYE